VDEEEEEAKEEEAKEAKEEEGNIFASVTSTACARTPCTTSHRVVKRARRIASAGVAAFSDSGSATFSFAFSSIVD
jgi:hypothetical protein